MIELKNCEVGVKQLSLTHSLYKFAWNLKFTYENADIEIVKQFNYLEVTFTKTYNFDVTKKHLADKALKAMYEVLKMGRLYKLSVKIQLDLFNKMIKPILLYGCEVWGFGKNEVLEPSSLEILQNTFKI